MNALPILIITRDPLTNYTRQVIRLWEVSHLHVNNNPLQEEEIDFDQESQDKLLRKWYAIFREPIYWFSHTRGLQKVMGPD